MNKIKKKIYWHIYLWSHSKWYEADWKEYVKKNGSDKGYLTWEKINE